MAEQEIPVQENPLKQMEEKMKAAQAKNEPPKKEEPPVVDPPKTDPPKAEVKKEEPPKADASKTEPAKEEKKTRKFWKGKEAEKVETTDNKTEPAIDYAKQLSERDAKIAAYEQIVNKPSVKHVLKAEESGKPFTEYYQEQLAKDPYKLSYTEIYKKQLEEGGATATEIERKLERFAEKEEDDQFDIVAPYRKQLKDKFDKEINEYAPKIETPQAPVNMWDELTPKYQEAAKKYTDKEISGVTMTQDRVNQVLNFYQNNSLVKTVQTDKGDVMFDADDLFEKTAFIMYRELALDAAYDAGSADTEERLKEEYGVGKPLPSKNGSTEPAPRQVSTDEQKRAANLLSSLPK